MDTKIEDQTPETAASQTVLTAALSDLWNTLHPNTSLNEEADDLIETVPKNTPRLYAWPTQIS